MNRHACLSNTVTARGCPPLKLHVWSLTSPAAPTAQTTGLANATQIAQAQARTRSDHLAVFAVSYRLMRARMGTTLLSASNVRDNIPEPCVVANVFCARSSLRQRSYNGFIFSSDMQKRPSVA